MKRARALAAGLVLVACRDTSNFGTEGGRHFEGDVVSGSFVRTGVVAGTRMCVQLDPEHLQDLPGSLSTSDGLFRATALRPIPQLWHDPLSMLHFGDGRVQNLVYVATPREDGGAGQDVNAVVSLMQSGGIEVRLFRGAPGGEPSATPPLFAVFDLTKKDGPCPF